MKNVDVISECTFKIHVVLGGNEGRELYVRLRESIKDKGWVISAVHPYRGEVLSFRGKDVFYVEGIPLNEIALFYQELHDLSQTFFNITHLNS